MGILTMKNSSVENTIWNEPGASLIIENVTARNLSQFGIATIKNCKFQTLNTDMSVATTKISGGEFTGYEADNFAVMIQSENPIDKHTINILLAEGYAAKFDSFDLQINESTEEQKYYTGIYGLNVKFFQSVKVKFNVNFSESLTKGGSTGKERPLVVLWLMTRA